MARLLAVTSRLPFPPREGHQLRSWHLLRALARQHEVTLLSVVRDDDDPAAAGPLRDVLAALELFRLPASAGAPATAAALLRAALRGRPFVVEKYAAPALRERFAALAANADLVHIDMLPLMALADAVPAHVPVVYNAHNVEHALVATRARIDARRAVRWFLARQAPLLRDFERDACLRADLVLACSTVDADALAALAPGSRVAVVPNGVDLDANAPVQDATSGAALEAHAPPTLVFVGQMGWFPNRDGVDWFLAEVLPRILRARAAARFVLVGKPGDLVVPADVAPAVRLAGFVPDVRTEVQAADVYVVPLRAGSGTRLKVLEAMALGKAIVSTRIGSEGIALVDGESALFADSADAFADTVVTLLDDAPRRARLGAAARQCAEAGYGWEAIGADLLGRYAALLSRGALGRSPDGDDPGNLDA